MKQARGLKVVSDADLPEAPSTRKSVPKTIAAAVQSSERELLVALRAKAAVELDSGVPAHAISQLMKQLRELDKDIRALDARTQDDGEDRPGGQVDDRFDASAI